MAEAVVSLYSCSKPEHNVRIRHNVVGISVSVGGVAVAAAGFFALFIDGVSGRRLGLLAILAGFGGGLVWLGQVAPRTTWSGAQILLGLALVVSAVAGGFVSWSDGSDSVLTGPATEVTPLAAEDRPRYGNGRFGYSFEYPADWLQLESDNGDGVRISDPDPSADANIVAWGSHYFGVYGDAEKLEPIYQDYLEVPVYEFDKDGVATDSGYVIVSQRSKIERGTRVCLTQSTNGAMVMDFERELSIELCAPSEQFDSQYQGLFLEILSSYRIFNEYAG